MDMWEPDIEIPPEACLRRRIAVVHYKPEPEARSMTVLGVLADRAEEAMRDTGIDTASFLAACQAYRELLTKMDLLSFIIADFDQNFSAVRDFYEADPAERGTLAKLCASRGFPEVNFSWLLWGVE